jgi:hypothetical protein
MHRGNDFFAEGVWKICYMDDTRSRSVYDLRWYYGCTLALGEI